MNMLYSVLLSSRGREVDFMDSPPTSIGFVIVTIIVIILVVIYLANDEK